MSYSWTLSIAPASPSNPFADNFFASEAAQAPADFGFDVLTLPDLDLSFTPRRDAVILADAFLRRLYTRRGQLWSDQRYGFYILDYLNDQVTPALLAELIAGIEGQAELEERIASIRVRAQYRPADETLKLAIALQSAVGPFTLVLSVTAVTTDIFMEA